MQFAHLHSLGYAHITYGENIMSSLNNIDYGRELWFYGMNNYTSDDEFLIEMSKKLNIPNLTNCSTHITSAITLNSFEAFGLFNYIQKSEKWNPIFEQDLQCVAQTAEGEELLTSWIKKSDFETFLSEITQPTMTENLRNVALYLKTQYEEWSNKNMIHDIEFSGYRV